MSGFGFMAMGWWFVLVFGFILFVVLAIAKLWDRPNRIHELDRRIEADAEAGFGVADGGDGTVPVDEAPESEGGGPL